jgi:UDPglucose--hexose-1-phosphate uridylyltransferase
MADGAPQLLIDELTGDHVIIAPARALRPDTFRVLEPPLPAADANCPFCDGHESETPPELMRVGRGAPDTPGWRVRVVPNKFPIAPGAHEVVILSPAHNRDLGELDTDAAVDALQAIRDRVAFHFERGASYVQAFINNGRAAGASIEHPHAQVIALGVVPPRVQGLVERFTKDRLEADLDFLVSDGTVTVWCPPASITPFAVRCTIRNTGPHFERTSDQDVRSLAIALRDTVHKLQAVLGDVAYNVVIETAPGGFKGKFQWWVEIRPRLTVVAGFELGTGIWINIVDPPAAAATLR